MNQYTGLRPPRPPVYSPETSGIVLKLRCATKFEDDKAKFVSSHIRENMVMRSVLLTVYTTVRV